MLCGYFGENILFLLTEVCSYCDVRITEAHCGISAGTLWMRVVDLCSEESISHSVFWAMAETRQGHTC